MFWSLGLRRTPAALRVRPQWRHYAEALKTSLKDSPKGAPKGAPKEPPKKGGIKALVKEYGYSALGVYLFLSALDLPVCYWMVHSMGKEKIERYENQAKQFFGFGVSDAALAKAQAVDKIELELGLAEPHQAGSSILDTLGLNKVSEYIPWFSWTEFAIAYGIHKSVFIFVRVPLTAAFTPAIVKTLRGWGFKIGTDKLATTATLAKESIANSKHVKRFWFF